MAIALELKPKDYRSDIEPTWCPGCGDFSVTSAICSAYTKLKLDPYQIATVSGIGCSSRLPLWLKTFGFHSCHGRAVPVAAGIKMAKPDTTVVVTIGDGDAFSIGGGHNAHVARRNMDLTLIVMDNNIYALTKNQVSPTSRLGMKGSTTPYGTLDEPMNTVRLMLAYGATFVAQTYAGSPRHSGEVIEQAILHKGFSFVNILSPCPTYNQDETFEYYKGRTENIQEVYGHTNLEDKAKAFELSEKVMNHRTDPNAKIPVGIFYKKVQETFEQKVADLKKRHNGNDNFNVASLFEDYRP